MSQTAASSLIGPKMRLVLIRTFGKAQASLKRGANKNIGAPFLCRLTLNEALEIDIVNGAAWRANFHSLHNE